MVINKHKGKPAGVFDIDGTFIRGSLFIILTKALCDENIFPVHSFQGSQKIAQAKKKWENRQASYDEYIRSVVNFFFTHIMDVELHRVQELAQRLVRENYKQIHVFTRELFNVSKKTHCTIAITGSQFEMVSAFQKYWPFDLILSTELETKHGVYTGAVVSKPVHNKKSVLQTVINSSGLVKDRSFSVGDTEGDVGVLEEVEVPICFNPNYLLFEEAVKRNWIVIMERKNLIMVLRDHNSTPDFLNGHEVGKLRRYIRNLLK